MKKIVVLSLIGLLILAFGTTVFAQAKKEDPKLDFKASGYIEIKSEWTRNVPQPPYDVTGNLYGPSVAAFLLPTAVPTSGNAFNKERAYMETRARLRFDAIMGKELSGTINFEMDSLRWGEQSGDRNRVGYWGADRAGVEVKNAFIAFKVPEAVAPIPITIMAGIHPLAFRPEILVYNDGPGITAIAKIDPATIKLVWFKAVENQDFSSDDVDIYGLDANVKVGKLTIGGFGLYYNMNTFPFSPAAPTPTVNNRASMLWLGLYMDGKLGPVNINFDFVYDRGEVEDARNISTRARDIKYRGWGSILTVAYPWEKFNFGATGIYGSGADTRKTNLTGLQDVTTTSAGTAPTKVGAYVVPPGAEQGGNVSLVFYGTGAVGENSASTGYSRSSLGLGTGTIGGTCAAKLFGSYKAAPWYKVTLQGLYIGDTTKHGNTVGTAKKADGTLRDDKTIGWEFNLLNEIKIYKNLTWYVSGGILFAGDAMDYYVNAANPDVSPKNPWVIATRLLYAF